MRQQELRLLQADLQAQQQTEPIMTLHRYLLARLTHLREGVDTIPANDLGNIQGAIAEVKDLLKVITKQKPEQEYTGAYGS